LTEFSLHGIININLYLTFQLNIIFLFRAGGGTSPMIPGNRFKFILNTVLILAANS